MSNKIETPSPANTLSEEEIKSKVHLESVNHLSQWKSTQINIGILGSCGLQKNSLIKSLASLNHNDEKVYLENDIKTNEDYELIGAREHVKHSHSKNSNIIFWEMPEFLNLDKNEFIDLIEIEKYDCLLICQCDSKEFDENEIWLADYVKNEKGIPVFFIRYHYEANDHSKISKIDAVDRLEFQIVEKINNEYQEINSQPHEKFYLMSCDEKKQLDFNKLMIDITNNVEASKSETMTFAIEPFSKEIIQKKLEILKSKTHHSAIVSSLCGIFTHIIPGVGLVADLTFLVHEIHFYVTQFGLCEEGLTRTAEKNNILYDDLMFIVLKSTYASLIILKDIHALTGILVKVLPVFAASSAAIDSIKIVPVLGHIIHGSVSFLMTKYALIKILDEFAVVALDIDAYIEEKNNNDIDKITE